MRMRFAIALLGSTCLLPIGAASAQANEAQTTDSAAPSVQEQGASSADSASPSNDSPRDSAIIVTGTRIANPNIKSAAPIQSVSATEIKLSGAVNMEDVLNRMPQVYAGNPQADQETAGGSSIQLRSFGSGHQSGQNTLTLIDGQRIAGQLGGDINTIPTALVERVDILTGGAAAVYGPDALAGVVNFILKKDFEGVQIDANYGFFNHINKRNVITDTADQYGLPYRLGQINDGGRANISVAAGHRFLDDRLSISGYFNYRHTDAIDFTARSFDACQLLQAQWDAPNECGVTRTSPYGRIIPRSGPNSGASFVNASDGTTRQLHPFGPSDLVSRYGASYNLLRGNERYNAGGFLSFQATDWAELYGSLMYTNNSSRASYDPASIYAGSYNGNGYTLNCANPLMSAQQAQIICGSSAGTNTIVPIDVAYRLNSFTPQVIDYKQYYKRATLGVRGDFASAWHYDISSVFANNINTGRIDSNWAPNADNISKALNVINVNGTPTCVSKIDGSDPNCVPLDIFRGNLSDQAAYNYIFKSQPDGRNRNTGSFVNVVASLSGDLGHYGIKSPLATDGAKIGLSLEYRRETAFSFNDSAWNSILAGSTNPSSSSYGSQNTKEVSGELQLPLIQDQSWTKALTFSGGYRLSKYSTSPRTFGTWKIEGAWAPTEDVTFRVARNFASRAPNVFESTPNIQYNQRVNFADPCGPTPVINQDTGAVTYTAPTMDITACRQQPNWQDSFYNNSALLCPDSGCVFRSGNASNLGPQEANSVTYGLVLTPRFLPRFLFSIDFYKIQFTNQISSFGPDDFVSLCKLYPVQPTALNQLGCQHFYRNTNGTLFGSTSSPTSGFISGETINTPGNQNARGYDLQAHYDFPLSTFGRMDIDFTGSITESAGNPDGSGKAGYFSTFVGDPIPKWRHQARFTFKTNDEKFNASINWRYVGPTLAGLDHSLELIGVPVDQLGLVGYTPPQKTFARIAPYNYIDLALSTKIDDRFTLSLIVNNLFDRDPPLVPAYGGLGSRSISGGYQNAITNFYDLYGRYIQVGISTKF